MSNGTTTGYVEAGSFGSDYGGSITLRLGGNEIGSEIGSALSSASWWSFLNPAEQGRLAGEALRSAIEALPALNPAVHGRVVRTAIDNMRKELSGNPDAYNPFFWGSYNITNLASDAFAAAAALENKARDALNPLGWSLPTIILGAAGLLVGIQLLAATRR